MNQPDSTYENRNKKFTLEAQYLVDLSFENPSVPHVFFMEPTKIDNEVFVEVGANSRSEEKNGVFEVLLKLKIKTYIKQDNSQDEDEMVIFMLDLTYGALVLLSDDVLSRNDELEIKSLLTVDCPYWMFPYARQIVSSVSMESGLSPLILGEIDFRSMFLKNEDKMKNNIQGNV